MENGLKTAQNQILKMGATGNTNSARLATLQERKKIIEESLAKCNEELKRICLQEADLTGVIPQEMPLEPGETPPQIRRRVGTAYQLPENLIKNSNDKDELITGLELQIQVHAHMAEAALDLAKEQNVSKTLRRKHMADYQQHKIQFNALHEKLASLKEKAQQQSEQLHKQKKKPRPTEQDDNISLGTNINEPFGKSDLRYSLRSNQCINSEIDVEQKYLNSSHRMAYKNSYVENYPRHEENLSRGFYALSINGYKNYMERRENLSNNHIPNYNTLHYNQHNSHNQSQHPQVAHYPHQAQNQGYQQMTRSSVYSVITQNYNPVSQVVKNHHNSPTSQHATLRTQHRQSSPSTNTPRTCYSQNSEHNHNYRAHPESEQSCHAINPHQIQPHQQYEHMSLGLGGYWKRLDNGEMVWCNSSPVEPNWQRDKRFGSLDRRKNKRVHKRVSPSMSNKSATLSSVPFHMDHARMTTVKSPQIINRRSQDNRQLVRTQSLGSVGGQTLDNVWQSDDNSSCESDNRSISEAAQNARRPKQKEWKETFLDGPLSPVHTVVSRSQSALPSVLSPEEKYILTPPQHIPLPQTPKPPLEIPAESNPSPRLPETNIELFNNNNIPKNCTLVQAGHFKPYHEETKPFEMADCYKYSTKFKKSPVKQDNDNFRKSVPTEANFQKNLSETFDKLNVQSVENHNFSPGSPLSSACMDNSNSINSSFDLSQISNANVAERFSDEMNAWYKSHNLQIEGGNTSTSKNKSTATLV